MSKAAENFIKAAVMAILIIMPFHAFLVVLAGSRFGHEQLFQAWKEIVLVLMGVMSIALYPRTKKLLDKPLNLVVGAFILLTLIVSLIQRPIDSAFWFGIKTDFEFLIIFVLAQLIAETIPEPTVQKIVLATGTLVALFGVLQVYFLPIDFLKHFGYGPLTVQPFSFVDAATLSPRIQSTLGGANQLGSFLILPIAILTQQLLKRQWLALVPLAVILIALLHTFSRSAWLGAGLAILIVILLSATRRRLLATITALAGIILLSGLIVAALINRQPLLKHYIFHADYLAQARNSDTDHLAAQKEALVIVAHQPWGGGLGTAGPASLRSSSPIITENYYLQLAIETGLIGAGLFIALCLWLGLELFRRQKQSDLARPLLAALAGVSLVNLFLHGWADSSTALVFWSSAGLVIGKKNV